MGAGLKEIKPSDGSKRYKGIAFLSAYMYLHRTLSKSVAGYCSRSRDGLCGGALGIFFFSSSSRLLDGPFWGLLRYNWLKPHAASAKRGANRGAEQGHAWLQVCKRKKVTSCNGGAKVELANGN